MDDLTKSSSLPHQVWTGCVYVREQLVYCRIDLLLAGLRSAKSLQPLIQELLRINIPSLCPCVPCSFYFIFFTIHFQVFMHAGFNSLNFDFHIY